MEQYFEMYGLVSGKHVKIMPDLEIPKEQDKAAIEEIAYGVVAKWCDEHFPQKWVYRYGDLDKHEYTGQFQFIDWADAPSNLVPAYVSYRNPAAEQKREAEQAARWAKIDETVKLLALAAPSFTVKTGLVDEWKEFALKNSQDGYSAAIIAYASKWGGMMERAYEHDAEIPEVANKLSHEALSDDALSGLSGAQFGAAVATLRHFWAYGDQLPERV